MSNDAYINDAQQRILRLLTVLAPHSITGMKPADIAAALGCSAPVVTRDTANLEAAGMAERVPETGHWRLAPPIVQISLAHGVALDRAQQRLDEVRNRFSRS